MVALRERGWGVDMDRAVNNDHRAEEGCYPSGLWRFYGGLEESGIKLKDDNYEQDMRHK